MFRISYEGLISEGFSEEQSAQILRARGPFLT